MTLYCAYCEAEIPDEIIKARHYSPVPNLVFCDREHVNLYRKQTGFYKRMSQAGSAARSDAVKVSNRKKPRRKRKDAPIFA